MKRYFKMGVGFLGNMTGTLYTHLQNPRIRTEATVVAVHVVFQFLLTFISLKVLTSLLGMEAFGEFQLAMTGEGLLTSVLIMPMQNTYLRFFHKAETEWFARSAGAFTLKWYAAITGLVFLLGCLLTLPFSKLFNLAPLTVMAVSVLFVVGRWRQLGTQVLTIRRKRIAAGVQNLGWLATQILFAFIIIRIWNASASAALFGYAIGAMIFAGISMFPLIRWILARQDTQKGDMLKLVLTYGLPTGALLLCQWVQGFADRYILAIQLDKEATGLYIAAFQICGAPYLFIQYFIRSMLLPIAFQRAKDMNNHRQLWSADKILMIGIAIFLLIGIAVLGLYAMFGQQLVILLTTAKFVIPTHVLILLACCRMIQGVLDLVQMFFAVHQRIGALLLYRVLGAIITVPLCWFAISRYGILGAAIGSLVATLACAMLLCFCPNGVLHLVRGVRRKARPSHAS